MQLHRFLEPLTPGRLEQALTGSAPASEAVDPAIELAGLGYAIAAEVARLENASSGLQRAQSDAALVVHIHHSLGALSRRDAADMRVWHWLTAVGFPEFVWRRWIGAPPPDERLSEALGGQLPRRFLGNSNLSGVSRNTYARLWWVGEALHDGDDYSLARAALEKQDLFQAVFERRMGLCPPLARACVVRLQSVPESRHRAVTQMVNHFATTTVLEVLDDDTATALVLEAEDTIDARESATGPG